MNATLEPGQSKEVEAIGDEESAAGALASFVIGNKKVMALVIVSSFSILGGLWTVISSVYKSGKGASRYSTKDEVRTLIKQSDTKNETAREKIAREAKDSRAAILKEAKESYNRLMIMQLKSGKITNQRLNAMQIHGARIDERTKIMNENILRMMKHMQVKKQN